jgi:hypothetical protein
LSGKLPTTTELALREAIGGRCWNCRRFSTISSLGCECFGRPKATFVIFRRELNGGKCSAFNQSSKSIATSKGADRTMLDERDGVLTMYSRRVPRPLELKDDFWLWGETAKGGIASVNLRFPIPPGKLRSLLQNASRSSKQKHKTPANAAGNARERRAEEGELLHEPSPHPSHGNSRQRGRDE